LFLHRIAQQEGNTLSNLSSPTADQLAAARRNHWRHNSEPILTLNMLRDWLNASGLVLYTPRAAQLPAPAPSFVEVTLGVANSAPTAAETEQARGLLARLVADGAAVPLNLLGNSSGAGSEVPDFIVSAAAFPYIFTLRGDKTWKQPPGTSGATKVSPLALATYNLLAEKKTLSAYDLVSHLGKEVTEAAVLRALAELWQHLRVIPVFQADGAATQWELAAARFTKQIKAGANAGQPTALSALISLYLGQALVATEEEIETFLSPLAARSRIRDVIHALLSARQLETIAVEGRTVLHVAGELPAFAAAAAPEAEGAGSIAAAAETGAEPEVEATSGSFSEARITKFIPRPRKMGTGYVSKARPAGDDRERRPFKRDAARDFTKPWNDEKRGVKQDEAVRRPKSFYAQRDEAAASTPSAETSRPTSRPAPRKPTFDREGKRPAFGRKPGDRSGYESRPAFNRSDRTARSDRGDRAGKPTFRRDSSDSRPPRREYTPRPYGEAPTGDAADRPRKTFSKPGTFGRKREGFAGKSFSRDRAPRPEGGFSGDRAGRSGDFPSRKPFAPRAPREGGAGPSRFAGKPRSESRDRDERNTFKSERGERTAGRPSGPPFRKFDAPRGDRPTHSFSKGRPDRPARPARAEGSTEGFERKPGSGFGGKKPFVKSAGGFAGKSSFAGKPKSYGKSAGFAGKSGGYAGKSSGGGKFAGKKPYGKSAAGTGKPASTFDKFKDNNKPFGKRAPARKFKPEKGESTE
jgi:hypothetical protein